VQVEEKIIASADEGPEAESAEGAAVEEESNVGEDDDSIAIADELEEDDDEGPALRSVESVVEEDANAAELDDVGDDEMHEVDVGEENNETEVQVQDDIMASTDEVAEAEDEGPEAETAKSTAVVEKESNAVELDDVGEDNPAADEVTEEESDNL
jgi:hypothetical protein